MDTTNVVSPEGIVNENAEVLSVEVLTAKLEKAEAEKKALKEALTKAKGAKKAKPLYRRDFPFIDLLLEGRKGTIKDLSPEVDKRASSAEGVKSNLRQTTNVVSVGIPILRYAKVITSTPIGFAIDPDYKVYRKALKAKSEALKVDPNAKVELDFNLKVEAPKPEAPKAKIKK